ncbi:helix-turn-helix transcriptional regulator [Zhongshania aliphaticivorans]|uniref:helix-turn-helix transcriptional regulator n=1 Tax=Zhongshania aliphaticivorans TaxID=1470434 RepID=UPI0012E69FFF|nr:AraC family transcriptional regulator [Zhongshania aliphaticivorans]CAA0119517.1 Transposon Tn10 TetD protein [Zhongshania aliphaticivorans]
MRLYLGEHWLVMAGPALNAEHHSHHAAQWSFVREGVIITESSERDRVSAQGVFIPPGYQHSCVTVNHVVMVYWEPEHSAFQECSLRQQGQRVIPVVYPLEWVETLTSNHAKELALRCVDAAPERMNWDQASSIDPRVLQIQSWVRRNLSQAISLEQAASEVHVSAAHLARLLRSQCGTTFRAFVRWARLRAAVESALAGSSLTAAAHDAGFSDSAHFSRTFRSMFGVTPQFLFGHRENLTIEIINDRKD